MKLHKITWVFIMIGALETLAAVVVLFPGIFVSSVYGIEIADGGPSLWWSIQSVFFALTWFGAAAMVEFLIRIWRELAAIRIANDMK